MTLRARASSILTVSACVLLAACGRTVEETAGVASSPPPQAVAPRGEIPPDRLQAVMEAQLAGLGHMERYEYADAERAFRKAHDLAPEWIPGTINLAIALLNFQGAQEAKNKAGGSGAARGEGATAAGAATGAGVGAADTNYDKALKLLDQVLSRDPKNPHAHYCRGMILEARGEIEQAHAAFQTVVDRDPTDAHAWLRLGSTLGDPDRAGYPAGPKQAKALIEDYTKALQCNPYLIPALFKLQTVYGWDQRRQDQKRLNELWKQLNPEQNVAGPGDVSKSAYGEVGRYARVIEPRLTRQPRGTSAPPPRFGAPARLSVQLQPGERWVRESDFTGPLAVLGRARARFGAAIATFDADNDGRLDIFLAAAVVGPGGIRDTLLLNQGGGKFQDATPQLGLTKDRPSPSLGAAAGDFDADGRVDLFLTEIGGRRLLHNLGKKGFEDVTAALGPQGSPAISPTARWLDLDQDGDLDLYIINYTESINADVAFTAKIPPGMPNSAFRNDGKPAPMSGPQNGWAPPAVSTGEKASQGMSIAFTAWTDEPARPMLGGGAAHTAMAVLDIDLDRDLDLVLAADGAVPTVALNDRLGRFHAAAEKDLKLPEPTTGLLVMDLDRDGRPDLAGIPARGRVALWRNRPPKDADVDSPGYAFEFWPTDAHDWRAAQSVDLDLDGAFDLLGLPAPAVDAAPEWSRNESNRLATTALALGPDEPKALQGLRAADLIGDPLPDLLLVRDGDGPRLAHNLGNGQHWLALDLSGRWKLGPDQGPMRTNPQAIGARVLLQGPGLNVSYFHTTADAALAQSVGPIVCGLGESTLVTLVRVNWPDGVFQCELNAKVDQRTALAEICRKTGSCPVLFTWNGERFVCIGDFLGGGGLGYLVAPGLYGEPDRDEAVAIAPEALKEIGGTYHVSVTEPMDEVAYLDKLTLDVVDRPPGVTTGLDERFAPAGHRPTGALLAWKNTVEPVRATNLDGKDVLETLRAWDRRTVDVVRKRTRWVGYALEHGIVLDFGDRLAKLGPADRVVLALAGWVEYPYSQTNYAAATAGVRLQPPVLERRRDDGTWAVIDADPGYPAGMPRLTTLDVTGKLVGPSCVLRLRTNMECYWDQAFLALPLESSGVRVTPLAVGKAVLRDRGVLREVSPDGRPPLDYDYDHVDPAPVARLAGKLTRYGDVADLLRADEDHLCVVGPGDEVRLEFAASTVPTLAAGWTRSYVLRAVGYCKDADPFTAASDHVGPLPWKGMGSYPFGPEGERPRDAAYRQYLRDFQTRDAGRSQ